MPRANSTKKVSPSKSASAALPVVEREVLYPEVSAIVCSASTGGPITVDTAKEYLGWEEETDDVKFGPDFLFTDLNGKKVRCTNNSHNRSLSEKLAVTLAQEHLQKRWQLNGETIVIGKCGEVISGQHRLISLVLAEQLRQKNAEHWAANWPDEVTMESVVVLGIDESDEVVNTVDTGKPRSFSDVLYRSELFAKFKPKDRKIMASISDYAVRFLWSRTGAKSDAYAPTRTHAEGIDFLQRHKSLLNDCVAHLVTEDNKGSIKSILPLGTASGLCYLMAASESDREKYEANRNESSLEMKLIDKAQSFWVSLGGGGVELNALRTAILDPDTGSVREDLSLQERLAMVIKAWHAFSTDVKVTAATVKLKYAQSADDGARVLDEKCPLVGGIDVGDGGDEAVVDESGEADVSVAEASAEIEKIRNEKGDAPAPVAKKNDDLLNQLATLRKANPGVVLFFDVKDQYRLYDTDADLAVKHLGIKPNPKETIGGIQTTSFKKSNLVPAHTAFNEAGLRIATVIEHDGEMKVTKVAPIVKQKKK